jgi:hypothetical protein
MASKDEVPQVTISVRRWQVRIEVDEPNVIRDSEVMDRQDMRDVMARAMQQVARASYMVNGPNREVRWAIDLWGHNGRQVWTNVCIGKSTLKNTPKGVVNKAVG